MIITILFIAFEQLLFLMASTHALYSGADHYWPLNEIGYTRAYDYRQPYNGRWHGTVKGNKTIHHLFPSSVLYLLALAHIVSDN